MLLRGSSHAGRDAGSNMRLIYVILTSPKPPLLISPALWGMDGPSARGSDQCSLTQHLVLYNPACVWWYFSVPLRWKLPFACRSELCVCANPVLPSAWAESRVETVGRTWFLEKAKPLSFHGLKHKIKFIIFFSPSHVQQILFLARQISLSHFPDKKKIHC